MSDTDVLEVDEDGFFCLVAPDTYRGFVDANWSLEQILTRFVEQMRAGSLFVAYPGPEDTYQVVALVDDQPDTPALREAEGIVSVGAGGLWLTDYPQLTMAAQFEDQKPITTYAIRLPVPEGRYRVTLSERADSPRYVLTISPAADDDHVPLSAVPWFSLD